MNTRSTRLKFVILFFFIASLLAGSQTNQAQEPELVKDINPGPNGSNPNALINVNGLLFFQVYDGSNSTQLWKSDGTETGTLLVKNIWSWWSGSQPEK